MDYGWSTALDRSKNVYIAGYTAFTNYPTTIGAYNTSYNGHHNVFVSKLDSSLSSLLASTFIAADSNDVVCSIALDSSGNVYLTVEIHSCNCTSTSDAYDIFYNGYYKSKFLQ